MIQDVPFPISSQIEITVIGQIQYGGCIGCGKIFVLQRISGQCISAVGWSVLQEGLKG